MKKNNMFVKIENVILNGRKMQHICISTMALSMIAILIFPLLFVRVKHCSAGDTYTRFTAVTDSSDINWPGMFLSFEADYAIALYDTNGNGVIDSYQADGSTCFPFVDTGISITLGSHIGSPIVLVPSFQGGEIRVDSAPGFFGRLVVYAEMINDETQTTYFVWFALKDSLEVLGVYDGSWEMDYGFGSYSGSGDVREAYDVYHLTYVLNYYANNGTPQTVYHDPIAYNWNVYNRNGTTGTLEDPGHFYSVTGNPYDSVPAPWGRFTAAKLGGNPYENLFATIQNVIIDVPLVAEENWDGQTLFPASDYWRIMQSLGGENIPIPNGAVFNPNIPYKIISVNSGQCLDVENGSTDDNANIQQYECHGGDNQLWIIEREGGYFKIKSVNSGKCLDVENASINSNANVQQYECHGDDNQLWRIIPN